MSDIYDYLASVVQVIRDDAELKAAFNKILGANHGDQRIPLLLAELSALSAPENVVKFVKLLKDDTISTVVLREINR